MPISLSILIVKINIFQSIGIEYSAPDVLLIRRGVPLYLTTFKKKLNQNNNGFSNGTGGSELRIWWLSHAEYLFHCR